MVAKSASRALGLVIGKSKSLGSLPYECYTKLFNAIVQPVIDYGSFIWGTKSFSCINAVQHRAERFFMGVGKYTPNTAVQGDMAWPCRDEKQWTNVYRHWIRMCKMKTNRLNSYVFQWAYRNAINSHCRNWIYKVRKYYTDIGMGHVCTYSGDLDYDYVFNDVKVVIHEFYVNQWYNDLNRVNAKRGQGRNKLRTYKLFKDALETECFLLKVNNRQHIRDLARFRCGVAPLAIETGRFNNTPLDNRLCLFCDANAIEDEKHVLLHCDMYNDIREQLFEKCFNVEPSFSDFPDDEKLGFVLSNSNVVQISARVCNQIIRRRNCFKFQTT
jgi:hypothetical protein